MKYFFTRKLMFMKESQGFVVAARRLRHAGRDASSCSRCMQTGKAEPAPDRAARRARRHATGSGLDRSSHDELAARGLISPDDLDLVLHHRRRRRGASPRSSASTQLPLDPLRRRPARAAPARRAHRRRAGRPQRASSPTSSSQRRHRARRGRPRRGRANDDLDLPRLAAALRPPQLGRLRQLIDALNRLPSPPSAGRQAAHGAREQAERDHATSRETHPGGGVLMAQIAKRSGEDEEHDEQDGVPSRSTPTSSVIDRAARAGARRRAARHRASTPGEAPSTRRSAADPVDGRRTEQQVDASADPSGIGRRPALGGCDRLLHRRRARVSRFSSTGARGRRRRSTLAVGRWRGRPAPRRWPRAGPGRRRTRLPCSRP